MKIYYNPKLKEKANALRKNATFSERVLWKYLRSCQIKNYQFMRQKPIGNYIVDFYCSKLLLAIEIDGISHADKKKYDKKRDVDLIKMGVKVLHLDGYYVLNNPTGALELIFEKIDELEMGTTP